MNMLFSCLFGVGIVIVRYRKNGVLKRLKATPVRPIEFISAQMASRFVIVLATSIFVYSAIHIVLGFQMLGSYITLLVITSASLFCMISLGLLFSSRIRSEELAGGLMNLVTFPMVVFSGVFFSLEGSSETLQRAASILPLSLFVDGARAVILEGASFLAVLPNITALTGMAVLFLAAASVLFAWE
jgi:ABC-type multidrug transport system permease subunit